MGVQRVRIPHIDSMVSLVFGESFEDRGSIFRGAMIFPVKTEAQANAAITYLRSRPEFSDATHRVAAYRTTERKEWRDDDGEDRAGGRLRSTLKSEKVLGAAVVVARWYGGQNLGKIRFEHFANGVKNVLTAAGHQPDVPFTESMWSLAGPGHSLQDPGVLRDPLSYKEGSKTETGSAKNQSDLATRRDAALQAALRRVQAASVPLPSSSSSSSSATKSALHKTNAASSAAALKRKSMSLETPDQSLLKGVPNPVFTEEGLTKSRRLDLNPDEKMAAQQYKGIRKSATTSAPLPKAAITERSLDPQEAYSEANTCVESKSRSRNVSVSSDVEVVELDCVSKKDDELDEDVIDLS